MAIKLDLKSKTYTVTHSKRHPLTRIPQRIARKGISSMAEAKRVEKELVIILEDKLRAKVIPTWTTLVQQFRVESVRCGKMTEKTAENYFVNLEGYTFNDWGTRLVDSITTQEIRDLIHNKLGDRSAGTQRNALKFIRGAFRYGLETGVIMRDPSPAMKFRTGDKIKKALTEPQVRTLLDKGKEYGWDWYPIVATALYTGMRNGELFALQWDKVNLENRTILVDTSWNATDGYKSTKSGNDRIVEIAPQLLPIFKELKIKAGSSPYVLPRVDNWDRGLQAKELRMFLVGLALPQVRFHDLRATWATILLSKGVAPAKIMIMGGWADLKTLMVYMRKAGIDIRGATDVLDLHNPTQDYAKIFSLPGKGLS